MIHKSILTILGLFLLVSCEKSPSTCHDLLPLSGINAEMRCTGWNYEDRQENLNTWKSRLKLPAEISLILILFKPGPFRPNGIRPTIVLTKEQLGQDHMNEDLHSILKNSDDYGASIYKEFRPAVNAELIDLGAKKGLFYTYSHAHPTNGKMLMTVSVMFKNEGFLYTLSGTTDDVENGPEFWEIKRVIVSTQFH